MIKSVEVYGFQSFSISKKSNTGGSAAIYKNYFPPIIPSRFIVRSLLVAFLYSL